MSGAPRRARQMHRRQDNSRRRQTKVLELVCAAFSHLREIEQWLRTDYQTDGEGFWVNWSVILRSFAQSQLFCAVEGGRTVGFAVWSESSGTNGGLVSARVFEIDIVVVKTDQRRRGIGTRIVSALLDSFRRLGGIAVRGQCAPESSISFWRDKIGMCHYPKQSGERDPTRLFMFLAEGTSSPVPAGVSTLQLRAGLRECRDETDEFAEYSSPAVLLLPQPGGEERVLALARPILCTVDQDIFLRLSIGATVLFDDKVKRLSVRGCDYTRPFLRVLAIHADHFQKELAADLASLVSQPGG